MGTWFEAISMGHPLVPVLLRDSLSTRLMDKHINTASLHKHMLWWRSVKNKKINNICSSKRTTGCEWLNVLRRLHQHAGEPQWRGFTQLSLYEMTCCQHSYRTHDMHTPEEMCFVFCTITISMWVWLHCNSLDDTPKRLMVSSEFHLPHDLCLHSSVLWFGSRKFQRLWSCGWKHRPFTSFMLKHVAKNQSIAVFQPTRRSHGEGSLLLHSNNRGGLNWALRKRTEHRAPSSRP